ncbi:MAG: orotate phosphoribosyltransferase [Candidatus Eremiobacteraeota bacterium]|nr:orotate phosphoribosyltransferase [Candidatus Eremiobacteraeota bacterium]
MTEETRKILILFQEKKAVLEGHFLLTSGLHSSYYIQCAKIFEDPETAAKIVKELIKIFDNKEISYIVGPAVGGILLAYELAKQLKTKTVYTERENGKMSLRRGFFIPPGSKVLIAEDVLTTGGSVLEVADLLTKQGIEVLGVAALVNRGNVHLPYPAYWLLTLDLPAYSPDNCPLCREDKALVKPGSRA